MIVFVLYAKLVGWILGALWSGYMCKENNRYFKCKQGGERDTAACNCIMWLVLMVICIVKAARIL